jgi:hypothetical protein
MIWEKTSLPVYMRVPPSEDERGKHHAGAGTSQVGNTHESLFYIVKTLT